MKLQSLSIIFIIIILPVSLILSSYMGYEIKTISKQSMYNTGVQQATHDAIFSFELNTKNDDYSNNAENKRSNIKSAVKTFENSLSTTCNLSLYNNEAIEEYIPAILFGLYDGFYMYAPSELITTDAAGNAITTYKHNLRNYVYYSERIERDNNNDIIIRYTLDNYVAVSGKVDGEYITRAGYLINLNKCNQYVAPTITDPDDRGKATLNLNFTYNGAQIKQTEDLYYKKYDETSGNIVDDNKIGDTSAKSYYEEAIGFTTWFTRYVTPITSSLANNYLEINNSNDPEDENSLFVQHKRQIMREKIEGVLNSSITAYARRTEADYKMPKLLEEEWNKIYNNVSISAFVQGMDLGFKQYNYYCVLSSTNNQEYVNPNLMYFIDSTGYYHDIRCININTTGDITGYKIGDFETTKYEVTAPVTGEIQTKYYYEHPEYACYECINGTLGTTQSVYDYINDTSTTPEVKQAYYTSLARERYNTTKLLSNYNK